jgi:outer membrane receptor protein involved in Fe transport
MLNKSKLAHNYPDTPTQFLPPAGSFLGTTTGTVYNTKPGAVANVASNFNTGPGNSFNGPFIPFNDQLAGREERYGGLVKVNFQPTNWIKFYDELVVQRSEENSVTPNQGLFSSSIAGDKVAGTQIFIPANNPFNPSRFFGTPEALTGRGQSFDEFGPWHENTITRTIWNVVGGTAQLPHGWVIDGNFTFGESDSTQTYTNAALNDRLQLALEGQLPGHIGQFYNPFTDQRFSGKTNGSLVDAIRSEQFQNARTNIATWAVHGGGPILDLCSGQVQIAGGLEYRDQDLIIANDPNSTNRNIIAGNFLGRGTNARRSVRSAYFQATVQIAVLYKPFQDLAFRATYSEAFVAPSLAQLFLGTPLEFQAPINDPHPPAGSPSRYNVLYLNSANPNLKPQNAYEYYAEAIWTPGSQDPEHSWWGWANGLTAYVDWYQIELRQAIGAIAANTVANNPTAFPGASVIRDPSGKIAQVTSPFFNLGTVLTDGIDFGGSYVTKEYSWGKLDFEFNGTYIYNYAVKTLVGNFPAGSGAKTGTPRFQVFTADDQYRTGANFNGSGPDLKLITSAFWSKTVFGIDTVRTGFTLNYLDSEADIFNNRKGSAPNLNGSLDAPGFVHLIGSYTTVDWQLAYFFGKPTIVTPETPKPGYDKEGKRIVGEKAISPKIEGSTWGWRSLLADTTLTFGIKNIFDAHPPLSIDQNSGAGYDFNNADPFGRYYYVSVEKKF